MLPMFDSTGHLLTDRGYCDGTISSITDKLVYNQSVLSNGYVWCIGLGNPSNGYELEVLVKGSYRNEYGMLIGPGHIGVNNQGLRAARLDSQEARSYIYNKYGSRGLERLDRCLSLGCPF